MTNNETLSFYNLTPERVLEAVEATGVRCTGRLLALNSMENRVYEVQIELPRGAVEQSRYDTFRVVKFYRPGRWSEEQILEEHSFLRELRGEEIPVVMPLAFEDSGATLRRCHATGLWFAVFMRVGGRHNDELKVDELKRLGRLVARMHNLGARSKFKARISLNAESYGREEERFLRESKILPAEFEKRYLDDVLKLCQYYEQVSSGIALQRVHGDLHWGNVLWDQGKPLLVDFDDSLMGPAVQDLWLLAGGRQEEARANWEALLSAYAEMRTFNHNELKLVEALRALRMVHFNAWIARRFTDPAFKRVFVDFGSPRYWQEQLFSLEEQLALLYYQ